FKENLDKYIIANEFIFFKRFYCYNKFLNEELHQWKQLLPNGKEENKIICVWNDIFYMTKNIFKGTAHIQCFPLYLYEPNGNRVDGISDFIFQKAKDKYNNNNITKEQIFYYVFGYINNKNYKIKYANNFLKEELPKLPLVDDYNDFINISNKGNELADLYLNYDKGKFNSDCKLFYKDNEIIINEELHNALTLYKDDLIISEDDKQMRFLKGEQNGKKEDIQTTIIYNKYFKITNIPLKAYNFKLGQKSVIEHLMTSYKHSIDKDSGIKNNPNDFGVEIDNPAYILETILRMIEVSLRSLEIIEKLSSSSFCC
ncbi:MAG: hypothetical protein LBC92_04270, partial [Rickettsiales bacterium]|nr:hypothetical protein [Rickettsiales bacterium]